MNTISVEPLFAFLTAPIWLRPFGKPHAYRALLSESISSFPFKIMHNFYEISEVVLINANALGPVVIEVEEFGDSSLGH